MFVYLLLVRFSLSTFWRSMFENHEINAKLIYLHFRIMTAEKWLVCQVMSAHAVR